MPTLTPAKPRSLYSNKKRLQLIAKFIPLLIFVAFLALAVWQIPAVREFFGHAAGEPAFLVIDTQAVLGTMPRPWRNLAQGGEGCGWRLTPISKQVGALHPEYIRLDHIYDCYVVVSGSNGNLSFDFSKLDDVLSGIRAVGAKPYISLSYMPQSIASDGQAISVATPRNWNDWALVVQRTIEHVSGKLGTADVYYEVWNEPDGFNFGNWSIGRGKNYLTLYDYAAKGAAAAAPHTLAFKFGGPAITNLMHSWFKAMADHVLATGVRMDFFSWHTYDKDIEKYRNDMFSARNWLATDYPQLEPTLEFHITEWGNDSNNNRGYDTSYSAAHTVAGSIEMMNYVDRAFLFEVQDSKNPDISGPLRWGRWGLFDSNGAAKPRYNGLRMLDSIADERLQLLGKGSWVKAVAAKAPNGDIQVVIANYISSGVNVEDVPITFLNIQPNVQYTLTKQCIGCLKQDKPQEVSTTEATLQVHTIMPTNSVAFVQLSAGNSPNPAADDTTPAENAGPLEQPGQIENFAPIAPTSPAPATTP